MQVETLLCLKKAAGRMTTTPMLRPGIHQNRGGRAAVQIERVTVAKTEVETALAKNAQMTDALLGVALQTEFDAMTG